MPSINKNAIKMRRKKTTTHESGRSWIVDGIKTSTKTWKLKTGQFF